VAAARWRWVALVWAATAGILFALYVSGTSSHHRYEDADGWGMNQESYIGEDLSGEVKGGERYRYVGLQRRFEADPGPRIFAATVILPIAVLLTIRLLRSRPSPSAEPPPPPPPESPAPSS
jgi:hypothetical protein